MRFAIACAALLTAASSWAVDFDKVFADSTLRIDYILSGVPDDVSISFTGMNQYADWAGRRDNLDRTAYTGNGQIIVTTLEGDTIYANSFSSLFSEWLRLDEKVPVTAECPLLIPMPREKVKVTTSLTNNRLQPIARIEHVVDPADILIRKSPQKPVRHSYIHKGTAEGPHVGVAILAEGYTADEMEDFLADARIATEAILSHAPFDKLADRLDFIAVETPSAQSGVSIPKDDLWLNTAFGSHFSTFYSDRYLTSPQLFKMYDAITNIPAQHLIVLANTPEYGGGGIFNAYTLTASKHPTFRPVVVHEFGHSFGGLADEYFYETEVMSDTYPLDVEPWEPNITTLVDFDSKWKPLLKKGTPVPTPIEDADKYTVGVYEGGGYSFKGIYRPVDVCRMRTNSVPEFCPACQAAIANIILFYTQPID